MVEVVLLVALAWVLLALLGAALLAAVRAPLRRALLPAAPLVGVAFLVVTLHGTGAVLPVRYGLPIAAVLAVVVLVVGVRRGTARPYAGRNTLAWSAAALAAGIPFAILALAPSLLLGDGAVVSPNQSNDGVWYVSVSGWLQDHAITDVPQIPAEPAADGANAVLADGPAVSALTFPLRVGQELVQAALNTATGTDPLATFTPWLGAWVLLIPGGAVAAASLLRSRRVVGLAAGVVVAGSAVLLQQVYNQNAGSVLGIALAPVVLACVVSTLIRPPRVPLLLAGGMLAALVGTYTEYAPFVGPVLVGATLIRRVDRLYAVKRAVAVVAVAVVVAPLAWLRAAQTLIGVRGGAADSLGSPFLDVGPLVILNRLVGVGPTTGGLEPSVIGLGLGVLVLAGWLLALTLGPQRGMWIGLFGVGLPFIAWLSVQGLGYTQRRAVEIAFPLALFAAVIGWGSAIDRVLASDRAERLVARAGAGLRRALPAAAVVVLCLPLLAWGAVNAWSSLHAWSRGDLSARHVDETFAQAEGWVRDVGGADGEDVSVLVPSFFEQHWLTMGLRDVPAVEYPAVRPDYFRAQSFWSGGVDRYWIVGAGVQVDADDGVVVESNARFRLLDLSRGEAVLAAPYSLTQWNTAVRPDGGFTTTGDAPVLVVRTPRAGDAVELTLRAESTAPVDVAVIESDAAVAQAHAVTTDPVGLEVHLPDGDDPVVLGLDASVDKAASAQNWVEMTGVRRVR